MKDNLILEAIPLEAEIWHVVRGMHPTKSPGPYGMSAMFFQKFWNIIGNDVIHLVQNVFWSGWLSKDINRSFIVLIPKVIGESEFKQLRSISLCNTTCKIISKLLANRIKPLLSKIISSNQSAFVPDRWIRENVISANEIMHSMKRKKGIKGDSMNKDRHAEGL